MDLSGKIDGLTAGLCSNTSAGHSCSISSQVLSELSSACSLFATFKLVLKLNSVPRLRESLVVHPGLANEATKFVVLVLLSAWIRKRLGSPLTVYRSRLLLTRSVSLDQQILNLTVPAEQIPPELRAVVAHQDISAGGRGGSHA